MSGQTAAHRLPGVSIRPTGAADASFILSLLPRLVAVELPNGRQKRATLAAIRAAIEPALLAPRPDEAFFVADVGGTPAGFVHLEMQRDFLSGKRSCHISELVVADTHDGRGIGGKLLDHAHAWARRRRCRFLTLGVFGDNARARALYQRHDFATDLIRMVKPLR